VSATVVSRLDAAAGKRLYDELGRGAFQFHPVAHAWWGARGDGVTVVFYRSGKIVVQGRDAEAFAARHLGAAPAPKPVAAPARSTRPTAGSDESGKGDYFGPLAVAAVLVRPEDAALVEELRIVDSKLAGDERIRRAEGIIAERFPNAVRVLGPEAYNAAHRECGNANVLLGRLHAEVLDEVLSGVPDPSAVRIVVDKFGDPSHVTKRLGPAARRAEFLMHVRAESEPAVAAASFLARAAFLRGMDELRALAPDGFLPLGASDPRILGVARALHREGGLEWLGKFAKLHFKTTAKATG
jgi:ribonuclease HIII